MKCRRRRCRCVDHILNCLHIFPMVSRVDDFVRASPRLRVYASTLRPGDPDEYRLALAVLPCVANGARQHNRIAWRRGTGSKSAR
jgi:hypothetical protein